MIGMSMVFQAEIIIRQTDKTCKKKHVTMEQHYFSTDSSGKPRFFDNPNKAFIEALFNCFDGYLIQPGIVAWDSFNSYDKDSRRNEKKKALKEK